MTHEELVAIHTAAIAAGLGSKRTGLLSGLDPSFTASLPLLDSPGEQLLHDLHDLNLAGTLADGTTPLRVWLINAIVLAAGRSETATFQAALRLHFRVSVTLEPPNWKVRYMIAIAVLLGLLGGLILSNRYVSPALIPTDKNLLFPLTLLILPLLAANRLLNTWRRFTRTANLKEQNIVLVRNPYRQLIYAIVAGRNSADEGLRILLPRTVIDDIRISFQSAASFIILYWLLLLADYNDVPAEHPVLATVGVAVLALAAYVLIGRTVSAHLLKKMGELAAQASEPSQDVAAPFVARSSLSPAAQEAHDWWRIRPSDIISFALIVIVTIWSLGGLPFALFGVALLYRRIRLHTRKGHHSQRATV